MEKTGWGGGGGDSCLTGISLSSLSRAGRDAATWTLVTLILASERRGRRQRASDAGILPSTAPLPPTPSPPLKFLCRHSRMVSSMLILCGLPLMCDLAAVGAGRMGSSGSPSSNTSSFALCLTSEKALTKRQPKGFGHAFVPLSWLPRDSAVGAPCAVRLPAARPLADGPRRTPSFTTALS